MEIRLYTPLSPHDCQQRLSKAVSPPKNLKGLLFGAIPIRGWVGSEKFVIYRVPRFGGIFFPLLLGAFESSPQGTLVKARTQFSPAAIFLSVSFFLLGCLAQINNLLTLSPEASLSAAWTLFIVSVSLLAIIGVGTISYLNDGQFLKEYLQRLLNASGE